MMHQVQRGFHRLGIVLAAVSLLGSAIALAFFFLFSDMPVSRFVVKSANHTVEVQATSLQQVPDAVRQKEYPDMSPLEFSGKFKLLKPTIFEIDRPFPPPLIAALTFLAGAILLYVTSWTIGWVLSGFARSP